MANYNTASDCSCGQDMPQKQNLDASCPESQRPCMANNTPCQPNMRQRQMSQRQANMPQRMPSGSCQGNMGQRQMNQRQHMHSYPMGSHTSMPSPCPDRNDPLSGMALAMAYVPWQFFQETYEPDKALQYGTIFPELNKPFYGKGGCPK